MCPPDSVKPYAGNEIRGDTLRFLSTILLSTMLIACSQQNDDLVSLKEKSEGIIITGSSDDIAKIEAEYNLNAEVISEQAGVYLVKGISQDDVKVLGLKTETFQNAFVDLPRVNPLPKAIQAFHADDDIIQPMGSPKDEKPSATPPPALLNCNVASTATPLSVIHVTSGANRIFTVGERVKADSLKSLSNAALRLLRSTNELVKRTEERLRSTISEITCLANDPRLAARQCLPQEVANQVFKANMEKLLRDSLRNNSIPMGVDNLEVVWLSEDALGNVETLETRSVDIEIKRVGQSALHLLVRDPTTGSCSLESMPIYATANPKPNALTGSAPRLKPEDEKNFFHLSQTNNIEARKKSTGKGVVVAIIDSGVNYNHASIRPNLYVNTAEIPDNGLDDDGNGVADDVSGYDFALNDAYPFDENRHGTHVAGIAAATDVGMAPDAQILPIKIGPAPVSAILKGMEYAVTMKADVINMSLRAYATTQEEIFMFVLANPYEAIIKSGIASKSLFVLGAGNEGLDNNQLPIMPANSQMPNAITVAAIDEKNALTTYSNFGAIEVDIAAYGGTKEMPIQSTFLHEDVSSYVGLAGTSMSTPLVVGIAAQVKQILPKASPAQVIDILRRSAVPNENLKQKVGFEGHADSLRAVNLALQMKATLSPLR
jgi:subtilisin family serine protease